MCFVEKCDATLFLGLHWVIHSNIFGARCDVEGGADIQLKMASEKLRAHRKPYKAIFRLGYNKYTHFDRTKAYY